MEQRSSFDSMAELYVREIIQDQGQVTNRFVYSLFIAKKAR